jgi:UDP-glucose 4-epimerase
MLKNKKIIILGANGYIGRHLVHSLIGEPCEVQAFDIQDQSFISGIDYRKTDVSDMASIQDMDWDVDFVFMFAGKTGTHISFNEYQTFVNVNEIGLLNILNQIKKSGYRPRLIYPSTRLVYEGSDRPLKEDAAKKPKTIYALNKLVCENLLELYKNTFGITYTIYRICVPYGHAIGTDYSFGTIGAFLKHAKDNSLIRLYGDGSLRRTFTHVEDICRQMMVSCALDKTQNEIFNVLGENNSLREIAALIADKYNARLDFITWPENDLKIESGHTVFDASKLQGICKIDLKHNIVNWINNLKDSDFN